MSINNIIEHTILKPDCSLDDIKKACQETLEYQFYGVCVPPYFVRDAERLLNEQAKVISVIGFPMGYSTIPAKVEEIKRALDEGANEVDAVINICALKSGNWNYVRSELDSLMRSTLMKGKIFKAIIETGLLTKEEMKKLLPLCEEQEVHFVKTSTGFNADGASVEVVKFLRENLNAKIKIKASGGVKTAEQAERLRKAGADRIGTSNGIFIVAHTKTKLQE